MSMMLRFLSSPVATATGRAGGRRIAPVTFAADQNPILTASWFASSASSSSSSSVHLLVNAVGKDRLGIVSDISKHVTELGGNVGESQAAKLGSYFSMMMLIQIPEAQKAPLESQLKDLEGMNTTVFEAEGPSESSYTPQIACKFGMIEQASRFSFWSFCLCLRDLVVVSHSAKLIDMLLCYWQLPTLQYTIHHPTNSNKYTHHTHDNRFRKFRIGGRQLPWNCSQGDLLYGVEWIERG